MWGAETLHKSSVHQLMSEADILGVIQYIRRSSKFRPPEQWRAVLSTTVQKLAKRQDM